MQALRHILYKEGCTVFAESTRSEPYEVDATPSALVGFCNDGT